MGTIEMVTVCEPPARIDPLFGVTVNSDVAPLRVDADQLYGDVPVLLSATEIPFAALPHGTWPKSIDVFESDKPSGGGVVPFPLSVICWMDVIELQNADAVAVIVATCEYGCTLPGANIAVTPMLLDAGIGTGKA